MENRKLIDYLPEYMQEYAEMRQIMGAQQVDVETLWNGVARAWANQFLEDADAYGVSRWERLVSITPKASDTLEERKFRLLSWWSQELPYTVPKLHEQLARLCGEDGYEIFEDFAKYLITIEIKLENRENVNSIVEMLDRITPANMIRKLWLVSDNDMPASWAVALTQTQDSQQQVSNNISVDNPDQAYVYTATAAIYDFAEGMETLYIQSGGDRELAAPMGVALAMAADVEQVI